MVVSLDILLTTLQNLALCMLGLFIYILKKDSWKALNTAMKSTVYWLDSQEKMALDLDLQAEEDKEYLQHHLGVDLLHREWARPALSAVAVEWAAQPVAAVAALVVVAMAVVVISIILVTHK